MKGTDDLKALLERLKGEVTQTAGPDLPPEAAPRRGPAPEADDAPYARPERQGLPPRPEILRPGRGPAAANLVWSENKETMLLGVLASVVVLLGGLAASLTWLTAIGAAFFVVFAAVTAAVLFGYARNFRGADDGADSTDLAARLEQLSRKVDGLALRGTASQNGGSGAFKGGNKELERKVEELRMMVRSLTKAVEGQDK
ncbi:MAG: hypothetical protein A3J79_11605 [Elusimicrobia bacterium RIFOXYB2_FULL_62_6]|nr:MAG: hypothetical protein A3J79_11605 [Elusimicrobia bacterium RIFOXYB2_FULL_62_6]